ncbi:MAG: NDP-sugar synthase [Nitrososphaerales archaeon]
MDLSEVRVVIPVGGQATRLHPLTAEVSKACVRFLNRPLIEIAIAELAKQGVKHFIFGVKGYINYRSLHDYFEDGTSISAKYNIKPRIHIKYQPHIEDLGSADSLRIILDYYEIPSLIAVVQGDNIFNLNLADLLDFHISHEAFLTICLTRVDDVTGYGVAEIEGDRIVRFVEKPDPKEAPSNLANTGIYILSPEVKSVYADPFIRDKIQRRERLDFGKDFIPYLIERGYPVYGYLLKGQWYDLGTPANYLTTMTELLRSGYELEPSWKVEGYNIWLQSRSSESLRRRNEILKKMREGKIRLEGSVLIGRHCQIGEGSVIKDSVIDNFTIIGRNVTIEGSAVLDRCIIYDNTTIRRSIIGRHVIVKSSPIKPTLIEDLSVIGDDTIIEEGCKLASAKIYPHNRI